MKETFYFSHDYNARNDPKLQHVLMVLGHEGKSIYWDLIEMLYESGGKLEINKIQLYAFTLRTTPELIEKLIHNFDLFSSDENDFWSDSCVRRIQIRNDKKAYFSECGKRGAKTKQATLQPGLSHPLANPKQGKERKGKEIKRKDIKEKEIKDKEIILPGDISQSEISPSLPIENIKPKPKIFEPVNIPQDDPEAIRKYLEKMNHYFGSITDEVIKNYVAFYGEKPGMKERVMTEINKARSWLYSNRKNKRKSQFGKFIGNWLNRAFENETLGPASQVTAYKQTKPNPSIPITQYSKILTQEEIEELEAQFIK